MKRNLFLSLVALFLCSSAVNADNNDDRYRRCVVMEEFTTENCPNCPPVAISVEGVMEDPEYNTRVIPITHHSGFQTDFLTTDADLELRWFYNYKSCYAPGMMFDRYPYYKTRGGKNAKPTPVAGFHESLTEGYLKEMINTRCDVNAHVGFDVLAHFDSDGNIEVTVAGERDSLFTTTEPRIWVYLTEDNINSKSQSGAGKDYVHQHTLRTYNKVWGDVIMWNGDNFDYTCTLNVDASYKKEDLKVVVFVSAFDGDDPANCVIENARCVSYETMLGIENAQSEKELVKTEYFTLDGMKTSLNAPGMYIQKKVFADGTSEVKKIMR